MRRCGSQASGSSHKVIVNSDDDLGSQSEKTSSEIINLRESKEKMHKSGAKTHNMYVHETAAKTCKHSKLNFLGLSKEAKEDDSLQELVAYLKKPLNKRTEAETATLFEQMSEKLTFFRTIGLKTEQILAIFKEMNYKFMEKNEDVFHYGEVGDTMYVVLKGTAAVRIPPRGG